MGLHQGLHAVCDSVVMGPARRDGVAVTVDSRVAKGRGSGDGFARRDGGSEGCGVRGTSCKWIEVVRGRLAARDMDPVRNTMKPPKIYISRLLG